MINSAIQKETILLITHSSSLVGGGEIEFFRLLKELKKKFNIYLILPEGPKQDVYIAHADEYLTIPGRILQIDPDSLKEYLKFFYFSIKKLLRIFPFVAKHRKKINVCYVNSSVCFVESLPVIFFRINLVLSVKEVIKPDFLRKILFKLFAFSAKKIIVISNYIKQQIKFVDKNNLITIIHSSIQENKYLKIKNDVGIIKNEDKSFQILNIGAFYKLKNQHILLKAVQNFTFDPGIKIKFIGNIVDQNYFNFCLSLAKKTKFYDSIEFLGEIKQEDTIKELLKSDCTVITSTREGFSLVLLESLIMEKPVISTPVGVIPEVIEQNKNGFIYNSDDSSELYKIILLLINDKDLYGNIKARTLQTYYSNFNEKSAIDKIISEINVVIKND